MQINDFTVKGQEIIQQAELDSNNQRKGDHMLAKFAPLFRQHGISKIGLTLGILVLFLSGCSFPWGSGLSGTPNEIVSSAISRSSEQAFRQAETHLMGNFSLGNDQALTLDLTINQRQSRNKDKTQAYTVNGTLTSGLVSIELKNMTILRIESNVFVKVEGLSLVQPDEADSADSSGDVSMSNPIYRFFNNKLYLDSYDFDLFVEQFTDKWFVLDMSDDEVVDTILNLFFRPLLDNEYNAKLNLEGINGFLRSLSDLSGWNTFTRSEDSAFLSVGIETTRLSTEALPTAELMNRIGNWLNEYSNTSSIVESLYQQLNNWKIDAAYMVGTKDGLMHRYESNATFDEDSRLSWVTDYQYPESIEEIVAPSDVIQLLEPLTGINDLNRLMLTASIEYREGNSDRALIVLNDIAESRYALSIHLRGVAIYLYNLGYEIKIPEDDREEQDAVIERKRAFFREAVRYAQLAIEANPANPHNPRTLLGIYISLSNNGINRIGQVPMSVLMKEIRSQLDTLAPTEVDWRMRMADYHIRQEEYDQALSLLGQANILKDNIVDIHYLAALAFGGAGKYQNAISEAKIVLRALEPDHEWAIELSGLKAEWEKQL